jgi:hypothetical protein
MYLASCGYQKSSLLEDEGQWAFLLHPDKSSTPFPGSYQKSRGVQRLGMSSCPTGVPGSIYCGFHIGEKKTYGLVNVLILGLTDAIGLTPFSSCPSWTSRCHWYILPMIVHPYHTDRVAWQVAVPLRYLYQLLPSAHVKLSGASARCLCSLWYGRPVELLNRLHLVLSRLSRTFETLQNGQS